MCDKLFTRVQHLGLFFFFFLTLCWCFNDEIQHKADQPAEAISDIEDAEWNGVDFCIMDIPGSGQYDLPDRHMRSSLFSGGGYVVAYPSIGGVVFAKPDAVLMQHIGLPRTHDTVRAASDDEDLMAVKLMQIGGHWWSDWELYARHQSEIDNGSQYHDDFPPKIRVAYPSSGGVWIARYNNDQSGWDGPSDQIGLFVFPDKPDDLDHAISWTLTMDERALILQQHGAVFYSSVEECPYLPTSVEEGKALYQPFEELLEKHLTIFPDTREWRRQQFAEPTEAEIEKVDQTEHDRRFWGFIRNIF
ncbi:hypothetical protein VHEMI06211 [[Torrubiella] hemipterigena]|uniref:Uncharacterized protein n=1 Tax=[Torrubiella] hemipterigena TaxID=1531966 RepID=A0A0A1TIV5_9HYPO|nr:hypothetical protein VHEMI06211 [[Torrubiella] hemipterigena]